MIKHYDVYMCREPKPVDDYEKTFKAMVQEVMDRGGYGGNSPIVNEWLEASWQRRVRQIRKEAERQLSDAELLGSSDDLWNCWGSKVAKDGFLTYDANGKLVRKKGA